MDANAVVCEFVAFSVESDAALTEDACWFCSPFGGHRLLTWTHDEEVGACDELTNGCYQMGVLFIVYAQNEIGRDFFPVFGGVSSDF